MEQLEGATDVLDLEGSSTQMSILADTKITNTKRTDAK